MRWQLGPEPWRRRFALLPRQIGDTVIWWEPYEARYCGNELGSAYEYRLIDPHPHGKTVKRI